MYHKIALNNPTVWWVDANEFYRQMSELASKEVVYLEQYDITNPNHVVITFDGIYQNVLKYALPILKHFDYPFELFLTSAYVGKNNEFDSIEPLCDFTTIDELKELVEGRGRLQWHTKTHINLKNIKNLDLIIDELTVPKELKRLDSTGFDWFAYPHGEFNEIVLEEVKKRFKGGVSCNQGNETDKYILNRLTVVNKTSLRNAKITCIIASYNYGDFLIEAIESVLHQTIVPDEILISDDCSTDDTQLIAEGYVKNYPNLIKYNRNEENLGIVNHFNKAIELTKGDYIFFLGADNRLVSNYVEECAKILDTDDKVGVAYTDYALFGSRAKITVEGFKKSFLGKVHLDKFFQINFPEFDSGESLLTEIRKGNFIQGSSMYKRIAYDDVEGYKKSTKAEDYNFFKRIVEKGWLVNKAKYTNLEYRQHSIYQANNVVGLNQKMLFYKRLYEKKNSYEKTKMYKFSYIIYKGLLFVKKNYNKPRKIVSGIKFVLKRFFKLTKF